MFFNIPMDTNEPAMRVQRLERRNLDIGVPSSIHKRVPQYRYVHRKVFSGDRGGGGTTQETTLASKWTVQHKR